MKPQRVLITGGAGFIASHVVEFFLQNTDYEIVSLDRIGQAGNLNRLSHLMCSRLKVIYHDLRSSISNQLANQIGPIDIILHLAASSHVTRSIQDPVYFVESNVLGSANLLEYARKLPHLERFIYFSTDEVFGPSRNGVVFSEYDRYNSGNPYSASKAAAEEMCVAYHNTYKLPIYITHTQNCIGERQAPEKFIPLATKKILNGETLEVHYDNATESFGERSYLHAKDVANALLFILKQPTLQSKSTTGQISVKLNISSGQLLNNMQVAQTIADAIGMPLIYNKVDPSDRPGHDFNYNISGQILNDLGWHPKIDGYEGIAMTAKWFKNNPEWL